MCLPEYKGKLTLYAGADNVRWKNIVRPGDRLEMVIELTKVKGPICKCHGTGYVDGKVAIEADITVALK
jgi:3-hydroxyacyl-[acyl-carrier-protein] dehydratase